MEKLAHLNRQKRGTIWLERRRIFQNPENPRNDTETDSENNPLAIGWLQLIEQKAKNTGDMEEQIAIFREAQEQIKQLREEKEGEYTSLKSEVIEKKDALQKARGKKISENKDLPVWQKELETKQQELTTKREEIETQKNEITNQSDAVEIAEDEYTETQRNLDNLKSDLQIIQNALTRKEQEYEDSDSEWFTFLKNKKIEQARDALQENETKKEQQFQKANTENETSNKNLINAKKLLQSYTKSLKKLMSEERDITSSIDGLGKKIDSGMSELFQEKLFEEVAVNLANENVQKIKEEIEKIETIETNLKRSGERVLKTSNVETGGNNSEVIRVVGEEYANRIQSWKNQGELSEDEKKILPILFAIGINPMRDNTNKTVNHPILQASINKGKTSSALKYNEWIEEEFVSKINDIRSIAEIGETEAIDEGKLKSKLDELFHDKKDTSAFTEKFKNNIPNRDILANSFSNDITDFDSAQKLLKNIHTLEYKISEKFQDISTYEKAQTAYPEMTQEEYNQLTSQYDIIYKYLEYAKTITNDILQYFQVTDEEIWLNDNLLSAHSFSDGLKIAQESLQETETDLNILETQNIPQDSQTEKFYENEIQKEILQKKKDFLEGIVVKLNNRTDDEAGRVLYDEMYDSVAFLEPQNQFNVVADAILYANKTIFKGIKTFIPVNVKTTLIYDMFLQKGDPQEMNTELLLLQAQNSLESRLKKDFQEYYSP